MGLHGCALSQEGMSQVLSWKALGAQVTRIFRFTFVYRECSVCAETPLQHEWIKVWLTELSGDSITGGSRAWGISELHANTGGPCPYHVDLPNTTPAPSK